ncbi:MAG TPA: SpoIIE family protein phosphatase [Stellaceae bacterium]|nr:SpoIIE family protein phosphatase [Stellaceae bacterium]
MAEAVSAADADATARSVGDITRILAALPIFARLDPASLAAVAARCGFASFHAGDTIMQQGRMSTFADVILDGEVDVLVDTPAGQVHVATVGRHRIIGELGAVAAMPRSATVVARTDLSVLRIERGSLMSLILEHPAVGVAIIGELGRRIYGMNTSLAYLTYAANALGRDEYDPAMLAELTRQPGELATFARTFSNMASEIEAKKRRRDEMQAAAEIQNSILPRPLTREGPAAAVDLHAEMHPAREIGGDFYDYFLIDDDRLAVTVADVSGKGIPAALFMAVSRTVLRGGERGDDMAARMESANRLLAAENAASMFVTAFHGVLDLKTGALRYCNAGHNPPYLLRAAGGRETLAATGLPFGVDGDLAYRIGETRLHAGDALFLFSDGITEAFSPDGEEFGTARLEAALEEARGRSAADIVRHVLDRTAAFAAGAEQSDDIISLALVFYG